MDPIKYHSLSMKIKHFIPSDDQGGGGMPPPTGFSNFSQKWEELFLQTKFLPVGSSLGHLPMKKNFQIEPTVKALKSDKGRVPPPPPPWAKVDLFFNHQDDIQS